jgi:hypothetical protein
MAYYQRKAFKMGTLELKFKVDKQEMVVCVGLRIARLHVKSHALFKEYLQKQF